MCSWRFTYIETADDEKYPDVPYFMLGHSMGSSLLRQYIQMYGNGLSGAIIMGTMSEQNKTELKLGKNLCRILAVLKGWHYRSRLVDKMVNGPFCKNSSRQGRGPTG